MSEENSAKARRSTRLFISIPIVMTGKDAHRKDFQESTRTLVVNKHGAKILTSHQLAMGGEVLIENRALGTIARANVVWVGEQREAGQEVGVQLVQAENIWGVEFAPGDWNAELTEEERRSASALAAGTGTMHARAPGASAASPSEAHGSGAATAAQFQEEASEWGSLGIEEELRELKPWGRSERTGGSGAETSGRSESPTATREKIASLEAQLHTLQREVQPLKDRQSQLSAELQELRGQVIVLTQSMFDSLRRAARAGFQEYNRSLESELPTAAKPEQAKPKIAAGHR